MDNVIDISNILRKASDRRLGAIFSEVVDGFVSNIGDISIETLEPTIEVDSGGENIGLMFYNRDVWVGCTLSPPIAMALADALREGAIHAS